MLMPSIPVTDSLPRTASLPRSAGDHNIKFIGPTPDMINAMEIRSRQKKPWSKPGFRLFPVAKALQSIEHAKIIPEIGYPVILKATAGGGGKGMLCGMGRMWNTESFRNSQDGSRRFNKNDGIYMEKFVEEPRHIEDTGCRRPVWKCMPPEWKGCSIQRRHQKLVEESPSPFMTDDLRAKMGEAAIKSCQDH